ncbi:MAG: hypothetical protein KDB61_07745, partial [Planctomycetes bacterium]|nr:hypothetical protein [Planctomycetota bacterium]
ARRSSSSAEAALGLTAVASADDLVVDASGALSNWTTIGQAMALAQPGDSILVMPGQYPAFAFTKGVEVRGMGANPSDVSVDRVDYHVSIPNIDARTVLRNLRLCGDGAINDLAISGNELPRGSMWIDRVETCAGVYLHGAGEFYAFFSECTITPDAGRGILGAAMDLGNCEADFWRCNVVGWDASQLVPAADALHLSFDARIRVAASRFEGGDGHEGSGVGMAGDAVTTLPGYAADVTLIGDSRFVGGHGVGAPGGDCVAVEGMIELGHVVLQPGSGTAPGVEFPLSPSVPLGYDPALDVPEGRAHVKTRVGPAWTPNLNSPQLGAPLILCWDEIDVPRLLDWSPFGSVRPSLVTSGAWPIQYTRSDSDVRFLQALYRDPVSGVLRSSNPVVVRNVH